MKKTCLYFDKTYKCVFLIVHYKGLAVSKKNECDLNVEQNQHILSFVASKRFKKTKSDSGKKIL